MRRLTVFLRLNVIIITALFLSNCSNTNTLRQTPLLAASNTTWTPITDNTAKPQHIALLLPLSGAYGKYGKAIKNGFFTQYYEQKMQSHYTPTISVFNTDGKNIETLYQTAVNQGADFIVGPLNKANVTALATKGNKPVTTLALNSTPSSTVINNNTLYEFSLSPTDEAQQSAVKIQQDQHHRVIIIAPNNDLGHRMVNTFTNQWKQLGGNIIATTYYTNIASLSGKISATLGITDAYRNEKKLKQILHKHVRFIPQRRQDLDSIFVIANSHMAKQIIPLLQFYFAGNVPTYSTSQIYSIASKNNTDLNGILFCNMPWALMPDQFSTIQDKIKMLWPNNYPELSKFYAMGIDAFTLAEQFQQLQSHLNTGMPAATGILYLTPQHYIYRRLIWAKLTDDKPTIIN